MMMITSYLLKTMMITVLEIRVTAAKIGMITPDTVGIILMIMVIINITAVIMMIMIEPILIFC